MRHSDARALIAEGVADHQREAGSPAGRAGGGAPSATRAAWADLGAGGGTFTRALAELLGSGAVVHAVDRDSASVRALQRITVPAGATVHARLADFTTSLDLPPLDGILMANALHFVPDPAAVLGQLMPLLRPAGRLLLVEYDRERGNPWVPYPIPVRRFRDLAAEVGLSEPVEVGRRKARHGGEMYAAVGEKPGDPG